MAAKLKFNPEDMPEVRRIRNHYFKYFKLCDKSEKRTKQISQAIIHNVNFKKMGLDMNIIDQETKEAIKKMSDSINTFRDTISTQMENILNLAANSHYHLVNDAEIELLGEYGWEESCLIIGMAQKYWKRGAHCSKPAKKSRKNPQTPPNTTTKTTPKTTTNTTPKTSPKTITKPEAKSPSIPGPSKPKSTTQTSITTKVQPNRSSTKATNNTNSQLKSTIQTSQTTDVVRPSTKTSMKNYFRTTKVINPTRQQIFTAPSKSADLSKHNTKPTKFDFSKQFQSSNPRPFKP